MAGVTMFEKLCQLLPSGGPIIGEGNQLSANQSAKLHPRMKLKSKQVIRPANRFMVICESGECKVQKKDNVIRNYGNGNGYLNIHG